MELMQRKDVPVELTWDLGAIYDSEEKWKADVERIRRMTDEIEKEYKGKLTTAEAIQACLDKYRALDQLRILTGTYCSLAASVDYSDAALQERDAAFSRLDAQIYSRLSFIDSELIAQDEDLLRQAREGPTSPIWRICCGRSPTSSSRKPSGCWRPSVRPLTRPTRSTTWPSWRI